MNAVIKNNSLNGLFDELFSVLPVNNKWGRELNTPPVNISEDENGYEIDVIAPGLKKEDFKINLEKGLLTISYQKQEEKSEENKSKKAHLLEYRISSFKRSFSIEDNVNVDGIEASYENGILQVQLPKKEEVKVLPKEIAIK